MVYRFDLIWTEHKLSIVNMRSVYDENVKKLQLGSWKPLKNWRKMTVKILSWSQKKWRLNNENHFQLGYQEKHGESKLCVRSNETCKIHKGWKATNQCHGEYILMIFEYVSNTYVSFTLSPKHVYLEGEQKKVHKRF